jgi:hypothetical protein
VRSPSRPATRPLQKRSTSPRGRWLHGAAIDIDGGQVDPLRMSRYD